MELQQEAINKDCDTLNLLRKAYIVAKKLKLNEFEEWINNELNGYSDINKLPSYRKIKAELRAWNPYRGWIPVVVPDEELEKMLSNREIFDSIASLQNVYDGYSDDMATLAFSASINNLLSEFYGFHKYASIIGKNQIYNIIEKARNIILNWSVMLEENGVLGEELQFTDTEKEIANKTATINNYTNNFYGDVHDTQIQQDTKNSKQETNNPKGRP